MLYGDKKCVHVFSVLSSRSVDSYPDHLMSQIPINYLIQKSQKRQDLYPGLFSSLLKYVQFLSLY